MIKLNELRTGNLLNYDTSEGETLPTKIDWQDLKWLDEDPKGFNLVHTPIPLTEELIKDFGFANSKTQDKFFTKDNTVGISTADDKFRFIQGNFVCQLVLRDLKYIHELQNIYYSLYGTELLYTQAGGV